MNEFNFKHPTKEVTFKFVRYGFSERIQFQASNRESPYKGYDEEVLVNEFNFKHPTTFWGFNNDLNKVLVNEFNFKHPTQKY